MDRFLELLGGLPPALIYVVLGAGAAIENVFPPVPADTFVLIGAFLAERGNANVWAVFVVTWVANVASALAVYALARRYGDGFFSTATGRRLLRPRQMDRIARFYRRWGTPAILVSRFLPAFRSIVPVFAGIVRLQPLRVAVPLAAASGLWYGALVVAGRFAERNFGAIVRAFNNTSAVLLGLALALLAAVGVWWWRTRRDDE
ncbi:MAG: DedA family protein [Gemmatimonadota bacterium]|jgi:membrane protein DedA with SNARE-associated domain